MFRSTPGKIGTLPKISTNVSGTDRAVFGHNSVNNISAVPEHSQYGWRVLLFAKMFDTLTAVGLTTGGSSTVQYSTVEYSRIQYSTVQYSRVQYSRVQYSTVQYSTVEYSTVQ